MKSNDQAKDLEKTNKEVRNILQKNSVEGNGGQVSGSENQAGFAKKEAGTGKEGQAASAQPAKKRIAAVYRPQNSTQKGRQGQGRPQGQRPARPAGAGAGAQTRPGAVPTPARPAGTAAGNGAGKAQTPVNPAAQGTPKPTAEVKPQTSALTAAQQPAAPANKPQGAANTAAQGNAKPAAQNTAPQASAPNPTAQAAPAAEKVTAQAAAPQPQNRDGGNRQGGRDGQNRGNRDGQSRDGGNRGSYGNRDGQGSRDGQGRGSYGNRDGQSRDGGNRGGYGNRDGQGSRDGQNRGSYGNRDGQGSRDGQGRGSYGNRDGQGSRDGQNRGSYGSRDGQNRGGYGNRDGQGSRDGQNRGSYGNRDGGNRGGYGNRDGQGSRDGQNRGSYGSRDGGNRGGYGNRDGQGSRDGGNRGGSRDGRGLNIPKPSFDTPMAQKQQNNKASKNAYKKEHDAKKDHRDEDLRGKNQKGGKGVKAPVMQQPKKEEAKVEEIKTIVLPETITIKELAEKMKLQPSVIVKKLFLQGTIVTINQEIDFEKAEEIAMEYDVLCEKEKKVNVIEELLKEDEEDEKDMVMRPPVICVMGHVDHGKTSLLDAIRQTNVTAKEAGGITQHIGAYVVECNGQKITFLDTPGHEAFTAMRMRGAQATDIAILVVAADDGVMPQTVEAINHAKAAGVEIIVAVNKIDKPSANVERVKQELSEYELIPEDWGGSTVFCPVSAHTKEGIPELLEMILLTAEVKELKANPNRKARGLVIEAQLDKGRGPVATVLVQKGTLKVGDAVAAGSCFGKVRAMMDDKGNRVKEAGPSTPVEILGLNDVPNAGEVFVALQNEKEARSFAETFIAEGKNKLIEDTKAKLSLDDLFSQIKAGNVKELPIIVKADVQGSVEAVKQSLVKLSNEEVVVKVIHGGVGTINESDVTLASASNAIIIGFNVRPDATAKSIADREKVDMRLYRVIYQAIEDVESAMKGMLDPVYEEQVTGHAVVRQTFKASGVGTIAGSYVLDGKITRGSKARITRDGDQIFEGPIASLKRFKDDVKEVNAGYECGLVFEGFNDLQEDDTIEVYIMVEVPR